MPSPLFAPRPWSSSKMKTLLHLALLWQLLLIPAPAAASSGFRCLKGRHLVDFDDRILATNVLSTHSADLLASCHRLCAHDVRCGSYFFVKKDKLCQLHSVLFLNIDETTSQPGARYYQAYDAEKCAVDEGYILERSLKVCYKVYPTTLSWQGASNFCNQDGGRLIEIKSEAHYQHFRHFLRGSNTYRSKHFWGGAEKSTGVWRWSNGDPVTWFKWASTEPSDPVNELCLALAWFFYYQWNDAPCSATQFFMCQRPVV